MIRFRFKQSLAVVAALATLSVLGSLPATAQDEAGRPKQLSVGPLKGLAKTTSGTAAVYELPNGKKILRLSDLSTENGPDLRVYLVAGSNGADDQAIKEKKAFVDLGKLKGNKGNQNYELPGDVDLSRYRSVSIWCRRFAINFGAATLSEVSANGR
jgi:hypothetical protein